MNRTELGDIVTDSLVAMVSGITGMVPPKGEAIPDFIQGPIDRAADRIFAAVGKPAEQHEGEPVGTVRHIKTETSERYEGVILASAILSGAVEHGTKLYTHADPGEVERIRQYETGFNEWIDKSEWARKGATAKELGLHLADVIKMRYDQLQADLTARDQQIDALRQGMKGDYDLDAWLAFVEEAPQLRLDAARYRWLRDKAHTADWEFIGGQTPDAGEAEIDAAMSKEAQT